MSEANQGNNPDASAIVPLKRRRGRPRKYPKMEVDHEANAHVPGIQNLNHGENAHAPPGFGVVNSNQPHQIGPVNNAIDAMIGQSVYCVIEATFDAGYLLNVRKKIFSGTGTEKKRERDQRAQTEKQSQRKEQSEGKQTKRGTERASSNTPSSSASFQAAPETNSSLAVNLPVEDSGIVEKKDGSDTEQALSVKPLQVLQPIVESHPAVASIPSEDYKTGKMTQLLQTEEPAAGSRSN
ncbi:hypothetical protein NC651_004228 [Populus alba x Populus x berolinensis]|nr:hypothetical protein NC651_004228 [Populus alba x Populus x berolinensis]